MAYREVTMVEIKEVLRGWLGGEALSRLAARLNLDRKTVRRYVQAAREAGLDPGPLGPEGLSEEQFGAVLDRLHGSCRKERGASWARCEEHRAWIENHLQNRVRLTKIRKLLRRQHVDIPYATLHRFAVLELGFGRRRATIPVADGPPGEEVHLDTGWMTSLLPDAEGRRRRFRAWIFTPHLSRYRFVYPCFQETTASAMEACEAAWQFYGGVFRVLVPDNTPAVVGRAGPLSAVLAQDFLEYSQARGFVVDPARVRHPQDKARTERSVSVVRDDCFTGEELRDLEAARSRAWVWCTQDYGVRRHTTTQRLPREHFETEEQAALLPLPAEPYDPPLWTDPKIGRDQLAAVAKALYSLPTAFKGRTLRARADSRTVRFYDGRMVVKTHPRKPPGGKSIDPHDYPAEKAVYAFRDVDFLKRRAAAIGPAVGQMAEKLFQSPLPWTRMRQAYHLLRLAEKYGPARLEEVCALALAHDMVAVHRLQRLLEHATAPASAGGGAPPPRPASGRFLRPTAQYRLPLPDPALGPQEMTHDHGTDFTGSENHPAAAQAGPDAGHPARAAGLSPGAETASTGFPAPGAER